MAIVTSSAYLDDGRVVRVRVVAGQPVAPGPAWPTRKQGVKYNETITLAGGLTTSPTQQASFNGQVISLAAVAASPAGVWGSAGEGTAEAGIHVTMRGRHVNQARMPAWAATSAAPLPPSSGHICNLALPSRRERRRHRGRP